MALSSFTSGAHGEVRKALDELIERGAEGVVLDLRHNGGGLLNEAVLVSSIFIPEGTIVSTRGRARPRRVFEATGTSIDEDIPVVVLVDRASASASEIVTGALQDRDRARVVGTRTFGKGVFQEIRRLSNGGALDITVGEYYTPDGRNLGGGGVRQGAGIRPDVRAVDDVKTEDRDEALDVAVETVLPGATCARAAVRGAASRAARGARRARRGARGRPPVVAVLERRGRFLTAEPFFARGRRMNVDRPKPGLRAGAGDLVLVAPTGPRAGHGRIQRRLGRPDVARDVLEALMLDRGLRRRFDPLVEREAREAAARAAAGAAGPPRRDLRDLPTFTIDPPTAKDFDDAISAERLDGGRIRVWVHIADVAAHVPPRSAVDREAYRRATSVYVPGAVEPMLPEALSNVACSLVPCQDRLAVSVELEFEGARTVRTAFHRSLIRSDARLDYPRVDRVFAGAEPAEAPWAEPLAAAREVAAALERRPGGARRARRGVRRAGVQLLAGRPRGHGGGERADGVAPRRSST